MNIKINKYHTWYNSLIERARNRVIDGYVEKHHIIPKSLGGGDEPENIVALTAREHLIAHMLLPRFVETPGPMWGALWCMMNTRGLRVGSRVYEETKIRYAETLKGKPNIALKGIPRSEETKAKISAARKGKKRPDVSAALMGRKRPDVSARQIGRTRSEDTKAKISAALKGKKRPDHGAALKGRKRPDHSAFMKEHNPMKGKKR